MKVALSRETFEISWDAREELLDRLRTLPSAASIAQKFRDVGTTQPVKLTREEKVTLLDVVAFWLNDVGEPSLPPGVMNLRNALCDERDWGVLKPGPDE